MNLRINRYIRDVVVTFVFFAMDISLGLRISIFSIFAVYFFEDVFPFVIYGALSDVFMGSFPVNSMLFIGLYFVRLGLRMLKINNLFSSFIAILILNILLYAVFYLHLNVVPYLFLSPSWIYIALGLVLGGAYMYWQQR